MTGSLFVMLILAGIVIIVVARTAVVVPQQSAFVVERLGRFHATLIAGFHVLLPFVDVIRYRHSLKERAIDIPAQVCITRDNVQVGVDGINEAEGQSAAILSVATATAEGIRRVADAIKVNGGYEAVQLRIAEQYVTQFGELAKKSNTLVLPGNVADVGSMIALAMKSIQAAAPPPPAR